MGDIEFSLLVQSLIALAFLPPADIPSAFSEVKNKLEHESDTEEFIRWFEDNYILGRKRKTYEITISFVSYHYFLQNYGLYLGKICPEHKIT